MRDHEKRDADVRWIFGLLFFMFFSGLAIQGTLVRYLRSLMQKPSPTDLWRPLVPAAPPQSPATTFPRLQISSPLDFLTFKAYEDSELESYGWLNRTAGVVRLPIERAMELVLQQGLPVRAGLNSNNPGPSSLQLIQQRTEHREPEIQGK